MTSVSITISIVSPNESCFLQFPVSVPHRPTNQLIPVNTIPKYTKSFKPKLMTHQYLSLSIWVLHVSASYLTQTTLRDWLLIFPHSIQLHMYTTQIHTLTLTLHSKQLNCLQFQTTQTLYIYISNLPNILIILGLSLWYVYIYRVLNVE